MKESSIDVPWKRYSYAVSEAITTFTLASFCLGVYFSNDGSSSILLSVVLALLYVFVVTISVMRMVKSLRIAAVMLMIPIAPLIVLIIAVALIHLLQFFSN